MTVLKSVTGNTRSSPNRPVPLVDNIATRLLAANSGTATTYIVSGDSTRDNSFNNCIPYYTEQFAKIGVTLFDNSQSGIKASEWNADTYPGTGITDAINQTTGTGKNTILEYSLGLNDYAALTTQQMKDVIKAGLDQYIAAKPDTLILLVTPLRDTNHSLVVTFRELSVEYNLPLVDFDTKMDYSTTFYQDTTHPNRNGTMRLINIITDQILPASLYSVMTITDPVSIPPPDVSFTVVVDPVNGYWSTGDGAAASNTAWRRLEEIQVEPNFSIVVNHAGNRTDIIMLDIDHNFVDATNLTIGAAFIIPTNVVFVRINLSNSGASYDALNDVPTVEYYVESATLLTQAQINTGLTIRLEEA